MPDTDPGCRVSSVLIASISVIAGMLTVLTPCALPVLPVIIGGSLDARRSTWWRPLVITISLVASVMLFTVLLKATSTLIDVPPSFWRILAGVLVVGLGISMLFPAVWSGFARITGMERLSQTALGKAVRSGQGVTSAILTGAALGPVFSSCSPTYAWVLATVLPSDRSTGLLYLTLYSVGLAISLLLIAATGRKLLGKVRWFTNPTGGFQRLLGVLFIVVGLMTATGVDQKVQTWVAEKQPSIISELEGRLVPGSQEGPRTSSNNGAQFNVDPYPAPDFRYIDEWINSEPLTMAELKGKVVLVHFWTYSCYNCKNTQPYVNAWHDQYADDGLVIVGVHYPEFSYERVPANVKEAVKEANISYPVALDNSGGTWRGYSNRYWPADFLIDREGQVRYTHIGEGAYDTMAATIEALLAE